MTWHERAKVAGMGKALGYILTGSEIDVAEAAYLAGIEDAAKIAENWCPRGPTDSPAPTTSGLAAEIRASVKEKP